MGMCEVFVFSVCNEELINDQRCRYQNSPVRDQGPPAITAPLFDANWQRRPTN